MAYSELIKNFNRVRDYLREFYIYGFRSRDEYTRKSSRSYDDERRRVESWLGDYMQFRRTADGKNVFISIDSRVSHHNPLYNAWKAKSFTDGDITLHFILFDILHDPGIRLSVKEIMPKIDECLRGFNEPRTFDESTARKKLNEYISEGIIISEKEGRTVYYRRAEDSDSIDRNALNFFSETAPCGVIGSYILDKQPEERDIISFKHHYITSAMDSEILYGLFAAMREKRMVTVETFSRKRERRGKTLLVPLRIMISVQSGRQYLMAYLPDKNRITSFRTDSIVSVSAGEVCDRFDELRNILDNMQKHMWGVTTQSDSGSRMEHVEFTVRYGDEEQFIHERLSRERRCGNVEKLDNNTSRFSADVYGANELVPWIRTFIGRITDVQFSDKKLEQQFRDDIEAMNEMYSLKGGEADDIQ